MTGRDVPTADGSPRSSEDSHGCRFGEVAAVGEVVRDIARERVGRIMSRESTYVQLRPLGGGRAWDVAPRDVRPMSQSEVLSALVAELNARSRRTL